MPTKSITGEYRGTRFTAENTWTGGIKLFQGGELIATNMDTVALSKKKPLISIAREIDGDLRRVEVFGWAILTVKLKILVDGSHIAGDEF